MTPRSPQQVKIEAGSPSIPSLSAPPSNHFSAYFTQLGRHCLSAGPPPPKPEHLRPLVHTFDGEHLPALPAITHPSLVAIVDGDDTKALRQMMQNLEGHAVLCHASTQAILAACTESDRHGICRLHAELVSNVTLSHLALSYRLIPPGTYETERRSADIFKAHIGSLYREAQHTGTQAEVDALVAAIYGVEVWPALQGREGTKDLVRDKKLRFTTKPSRRGTKAGKKAAMARRRTSAAVKSVKQEQVDRASTKRAKRLVTVEQEDRKPFVAGEN